MISSAFIVAYLSGLSQVMADGWRMDGGWMADICKFLKLNSSSIFYVREGIDAKNFISVGLIKGKSAEVRFTEMSPSKVQ